MHINYLVSCGSLPIITLPTRVAKKSSAIIDHIVTADTSHQCRCYGGGGKGRSAHPLTAACAPHFGLLRIPLWNIT